MIFAETNNIDTTIEQSSSVIKEIADTLFNTRSIITFVLAILVALVAGRLVAFFLRRLTAAVGRKADKVEDLDTVNRLRRVETLIVLSIALIRSVLIALAVYFWWLFSHPEQQPTAIIGASAIFAVIAAGTLVPLLRDFAYGSVMMAEHWFGLGDHVQIEPFDNMRGVVERVTLRSTRLRGINGEVIWVNNQNIAAVRVTPKGVKTIALELFVSDVDKGAWLVEDANLRLPTGALAVTSPLTIMTQSHVGNKLWHITALAEVSPGREWLIDEFAINVIKELDEKEKVLAHEPITRYADSEAERRFARAIKNARKHSVKRKSVMKKVTEKRTKRSDRTS